jgi:Coenzyme PQQ synthesis protein D (PqqD)
MTVLSLESVVVRRREAVDTEVNGEIVALQTETGGCYGLNLIGSEIWRAIHQPARVADLCAAILRDYEIDAASCERDVLALLKILHQEAMIDIAAQGEDAAALR